VIELYLLDSFIINYKCKLKKYSNALFEIIFILKLLNCILLKKKSGIDLLRKLKIQWKNL